MQYLTESGTFGLPAVRDDLDPDNLAVLRLHDVARWDRLKAPTRELQKKCWTKKNVTPLPAPSPFQLNSDMHILDSFRQFSGGLKMPPVP